MSATLNSDVTRKIATLARLKLTDEEVVRYSSQMSQVLGYIEQLKEVQVTGVEPMVQALPGCTHTRPDEAHPVERDAEGHLPTTKHAPSVLHDSFKVHGIL